MIYFLDFEASSLLPGSFPIEVAWVDQDGHGESCLIRPHAEWLEGDCPGWSPESEAFHGISLETLINDGVPIEQVAARAARLMFAPGAVAFTDGPGFDGQWLDTLFDYGGVPGRIGLYSVIDAYGQACRPLMRLLPPPAAIGRERAEERISKLATGFVSRAQELEALQPRTRHRALPDAESLWRTWRSVGEQVAEWMAKEIGA